MEIVQVAGLYPPHLGGEELVVQRLADMQARNHRVTVYTSDVGATGTPRRQEEERLEVVRDRAWPVGNTPVVPRLLPRLLRHRPKPDIIHVHTGLALTPEVVRLAARVRSVPYVAHVHLLVRPSSRAGRVLLPLYHRTLHGRFLRSAARVICLTHAMRDAVAEEFGTHRDRISVIPNGVDLGLFYPGERSRRDPRELLFVGRLTPQKNVLAAVDAMAHLPDATLRVVGSGELQGAVERRIAALGLSNVRLDGRLDHRELAVAYRRCAAVVMPSTHEGLPLTLLEAMAAGAPVVCSALPELIETGGDAVRAVDRLDPPALAGALRSLLDDAPARERLSRAAARRATGFSWPAVAASVDEVYDQVRAERT
jgi:glycosyltransferase involved in cell wall biosynthesis